MLRPRFTRGGMVALVAATSLAMSACESLDTKHPVGTIGHVKGFAGAVAADEPRAVLAGRDVLSAGGTAVDAAVAMYFVMAVTYPSGASLGGGGSCIVHDNGKKKTEVLDFPAIASVAASPLPSAVPANPRGFFALHAKYGSLRFESLLAEAEKLARGGFPVSRALAADLSRSVAVLGRDPVARSIFFRPDGAVLREGETLNQSQLAATISNIRRSTGDFYQGVGARNLVGAYQAAAGSLTLEDMREIRPQWRPTLTVRVGDETAHFAPPPAVGSTNAGELIGMLWSRWDDASAEERPHLLAEASARAFADRARWMQPNGWTTQESAGLLAPEKLKGLMADYNPDRHVPVSGVSASPTEQAAGAALVAMDGKGMAVACGVTAYGAFGSGRMAPGTGIFIAGVPGPNGPPAVTIMLSVNHNTNEPHFAGAATGGGTAPAALVETFLAATIEHKSLEEALAAPRLVQPGQPDAAFIESAPQALDPAPLQRRGHQTNAVTMPSRVQALHCRDGYKNSETCEVGTDPRGFGMAVSAGKS